MNVRRWLAMVFVILTLADCAQPAAGPGQGPLGSPSQYNNENVHDRGLGGSGM
jgi:hypothetical protein